MEIDEKSSPTGYVPKVFTLSKKYPHVVEKTLVGEEQISSKVLLMRRSFLWSNPFSMNVFRDMCLATLEGSTKRETVAYLITFNILIY